jgi:hypothetical protein
MVCAEVDKGSLIDEDMVAVILKGRLVRVIIVVEYNLENEHGTYDKFIDKFASE